MDDLDVLPLHHHKNYLQKCCELINSEWKRSDTARLRSLESSSGTLPTSLILVQNNNVIGHLKLSAIPSCPDSCFVESVVIQQELRGRGYGTIIMKSAEDYCKQHLRLKTIYLSTKGQEGFYQKLGFNECPPISIYGGYTAPVHNDINYNKNSKDPIIVTISTPKPPPLPSISINSNAKTFMRKELT